MNTIKHNGKDIPVVEAKTKTIIKNKETGVIYKDDEEWKKLGIDPNNIRRDVKVTIPKLDLFAKTKY